MLRTPDQDVRPQIEAAKAYLTEEGFADIDDSIQQHALDTHQHTILMTFRGKRRILRLDYGWLGDHSPGAVRDWLAEKVVGQMLAEPDTGEGSISQSGLINYKFTG